MLYTVKEVSELSRVTVKTLYHYHRIGLLLPAKISEAGYRLYGQQELERLQEILFYRELDFPLEQIKGMLERHSDRLSILQQQEELLVGRQQRLEDMLHTLRSSITSIKEGITMEQGRNQDMFKGLSDRETWNEALDEQNKYLRETYGIEPFEVEGPEVGRMNEQAAEAAAFMAGLADLLRAGVKHNDETVRHLVRDHLAALQRYGHDTSAEAFAAQTRFFLNDDFHLRMLEDQQVGLAYYLSAAAADFAETAG